MPTDESYLDNLLKGLTSDAGKKEDDRLATYRRRRDGEIRDSFDRQEIPGFLNDYIEEDKRLQFHVLPDEADIDPMYDDFEGNDEFTGEHSFLDEDSRDDEDFGQDADDTIENYNIFEDEMDDSLIDEMIANELSEEYNPGKPFGVSEKDEEELTYSIDDEEDYRQEEAESDAEAMEINAPEEQAEDTFEDNTEEQLEAYDTTVEMAGAEEADYVEPEDSSNVTIVSNGDEVSLVDTAELDSLFDAEDADSVENTEAAEDIPELMEEDSNVEIIETSEETPADEITEIQTSEGGEDEWVVDNSVEELPPEPENEEGDLADIFSGGGESASEPQSLNDYEGLEGLSSEDINSLDGLFSELQDDEGGDDSKNSKKKEKLPFLLRLFGNVPIPEDKIKPEPSEEEMAAKKAEAAEKKKAQKEEKKKAADEKKKAAAEAKAAKAKQTAEEKAEAKAKKKEQMEKLLLEDVGNTQKLNLAGCIVVFAMFAAIAALIISSINTASYNASIKEAEKYFDQALAEKNPDLYTDAYNQLLGLKIKDKDKILEDKVYTVNFVNVEITSFNNHYAMGDKTKALRDLLQGVMIYNFYIDHAYELEIEDHLLYLRSILIGLLESEYDISEDEAVRIIHNYDDMEKKQGELPANRYLTMYIFDKVREISSKK